MKRYIALFLIALMAVTVVSAAGVVTAAPVMKPLPTPNLETPKNNAMLPSEQPWTVLLQWKPVESTYLKEYKVEIEQYRLSIAQWWYVTSYIASFTTDTNYQVDLSGYISNEYRWRVIALSTESGFDSAPSSWRSFSFGPLPDTPFATPHVLSPANNIKVGLGMPLTLNWNPVPGTESFTVTRQKLVDGVWIYENPEVITYYDFLPYDYPGWSMEAGTFRWHVVAYSWGVYSEPSTWRTFTVFE